MTPALTQRRRIVAGTPQPASAPDNARLKEEIKSELLADPKFKFEIIQAAMSEARNIQKGNDGATPVAGKDYYTDTEKTELIAYIENRIRTPQDGAQGPMGPRGPMGPQGPKGERGAAGKSVDSADVHNMVAKAVSDVFKGKSSITADDVTNIVKSLQKDLDFRAIVAGIEALPLKERLDYNKLRNLPGKKLYDETKKRTLHRGGGSSTGSPTYTFDLSSQCDGVSKIFTVPAHTRALLLLGSDAPFGYRPSTDYTTSGTSLSLTSEVAAPLAGATLLFVYVE